MPQADYDFIVVGSGAGGGPLAANLALAGFIILLIEAGEDKINDNYSIPAFHALASEDPQTSWEFFVEHYSEETRRTKEFDPKYDNGIFYPRASALGGCTAHHALITVYPAESDWNEIATEVGDESWNAENMRQYYDRVENARYRDASVLYSLPGIAELSDLAAAIAKSLVEGVKAIGEQLERQLKESKWLRGDLSVVTGSELGLGARAPHGAGWLTVTQADPKLLLNDDRGAKQAVIAAIKTALARGIAFMPGLNPNDPRVAREKLEGVNIIPISVDNGRRSGARERILRAQALLQSATEQGLPAGRLDVQTNTFVTNVEFDDPADPQRATGVRCLIGKSLYAARHHSLPVREPEGERVFSAKNEVILCGGAFNTPQLLMLSGIGPREELERLGIKVRIESPGVGKNLQDRYEVGVVAGSPSRIRYVDKAHEPGDPHYTQWKESGKGIYATNGSVVGIVMRSSVRKPTDAPDLYIFGVPTDFRGYRIGYSDHAKKAKQHFTWAVLKGHTENRSGEVTLRSPSPLDRPVVNFKYFDESCEAHEKDLQAVVDGVKFALEINQAMIDAGTFDQQLDPKPDDDLYEFVKRTAWGHHASCTCKIGANKDKFAVLDENFRVRGAKNLRVVDASVFPRIPGLFIVASVYMISEKASDTIIRQYRT